MEGRGSLLGDGVGDASGEDEGKSSSSSISKSSEVGSGGDDGGKGDDGTGSSSSGECERIGELGTSAIVGVGSWLSEEDGNGELEREDTSVLTGPGSDDSIGSSGVFVGATSTGELEDEPADGIAADGWRE